MRHHSSYTKITLLVILLQYGCSTPNRLVETDKTLSANSEKWMVTTSDGKSKPGFGPYITASFNKVDSPKYYHNSQKFFSINYWGRVDSSKTRKVYNLKLTKDTDTASVTIFYWIKETTRQPSMLDKLFDKKAQPTVYTRKTVNGYIELNNDTTVYNFAFDPLEGVQRMGGTLTYATEKDSISSITQYSDGKKESVFSTGPYNKALTIINSAGDVLAMLQLAEPRAVWLHKSIGSNKQMAYAALFAAVMAISKHVGIMDLSTSFVN